jgi:hypothetical protein
MMDSLGQAPLTGRAILAAGETLADPATSSLVAETIHWDL